MMGQICSPPRGKDGEAFQRRVGLEVVLFSSSLGIVSRGSLLSARGYSPLYRMRRPTARIAWTAQPMRHPQRDRDAESPAFTPRHVGGCGKPVDLQQGSCVFPQAVYSRPSRIISSLSLSLPLPATRQEAASRTTHRAIAQEACHHHVRGDRLASGCVPEVSSPLRCRTDSTGCTGTRDPSQASHVRSDTASPRWQQRRCCASPLSVSCHVTFPGARMHDGASTSRHRQQAKQQANGTAKPQTISWMHQGMLCNTNSLLTCSWGYSATSNLCRATRGKRETRQKHDI